jgi:hypothetical protein
MNPSTTILQGTRTITFDGQEANRCPTDLYDRYEQLLEGQHLGWTEHLRFRRLLGTGGQGVVYLSDRRGCDGFTLPVALKVFSPERFSSQQSYDNAMNRMAAVACAVAQIQHDSLLDVQNFIERNRIRIMEMEWVDGYDLDRLLTPAMLARVQQRVSNRRWDYINNVVVTAGPVRPRLKPGIAAAIVRQCLSALAALHREEIVHGDLKPANIMVKRTGNAKIVDIGSALHLNNMPEQRTCTPQYVSTCINCGLVERSHRIALCLKRKAITGALFCRRAQLPSQFWLHQQTRKLDCQIAPIARSHQQPCRRANQNNHLGSPGHPRCNQWFADSRRLDNRVGNPLTSRMDNNRITGRNDLTDILTLAQPRDREWRFVTNRSVLQVA